MYVENNVKKVPGCEREKIAMGKMRKLQREKMKNYDHQLPRATDSLTIQILVQCLHSSPTKHNEIRTTANFSPFCPIHCQGQGVWSFMHKIFVFFFSVYIIVSRDDLVSNVFIKMSRNKYT